MRSALVGMTAAGVLALPASAAVIDPASLVLRQTDLPRGFVVDRDDTGVRTNEQEARGQPAVRRVFARAGRLTGYEAEFDRNTDSVSSRVDVFRGTAGARIVLDFFAAELRRSGVKGLVRKPLAIGDQGWVYGGRVPIVFTLVVWRSGRVFSGLATTGLTRARTVALARVQQRRIAAALG